MKQLCCLTSASQYQALYTSEPEWRPSPVSIHSSKPWWQAFREFQSCKVQACLGPITESRPEWSACQEPDLWNCLFICSKLKPWFPEVYTGFQWTFKSLMSKRCVKSPVVEKSFLCMFTLVRAEDGHKRRMEVRMKRATHERHILQKSIKRGRRQRLLLFFHPFFFSPILDRVKSYLAPFVVVFLHSCCSLFYHFSNQLLKLWSQAQDPEGFIFGKHTHTHSDTHAV